jgi:hypothetical protein
MREFLRSILGLFKPKPSGANTSLETPGDGSNQSPDGTEAEVAVRVPGMS